MTTRTPSTLIPILAAALLCAACGRGTPEPRAQASDTPDSSPETQEPAAVNTDDPRSPAVPDKVVKTDEEWKKILTPEQFRITRMAGTERPFTGEYTDTETPGIYSCVCCNTPLFASETAVALQDLSSSSLADVSTKRLHDVLLLP